MKMTQIALGTRNASMPTRCGLRRFRWGSFSPGALTWLAFSSLFLALRSAFFLASGFPQSSA
jgi:hypothetical protein